MKTSLPNGRWIFTGTLNMTKLIEDSSGPSPLLADTKKETWRLLKNRFNLADALSLLCGVTRSYFTQRGVRGTRLDQYRIDRFYNNDQGWWLGHLVGLTHIADQPLSDHDLILLKLNVTIPNSEEAHLKWYGYFKANHTVLRKPENIDLLKNSWEDHPWTLDVGFT